MFKRAPKVLLHAWLSASDKARQYAMMQMLDEPQLGQWMTGEVVCWNCWHSWTGVWPAGVGLLECPHCLRRRGLPSSPEEAQEAKDELA